MYLLRFKRCKQDSSTNLMDIMYPWEKSEWNEWAFSRQQKRWNTTLENNSLTGKPNIYSQNLATILLAKRNSSFLINEYILYQSQKSTKWYEIYTAELLDLPWPRSKISNSLLLLPGIFPKFLPAWVWCPDRVKKAPSTQDDQDAADQEAHLAKAKWTN